MDSNATVDRTYTYYKEENGVMKHKSFVITYSFELQYMDTCEHHKRVRKQLINYAKDIEEFIVNANVWYTMTGGYTKLSYTDIERYEQLFHSNYAIMCKTKDGNGHSATNIEDGIETVEKTEPFDVNTLSGCWVKTKYGYANIKLIEEEYRKRERAFLDEVDTLMPFIASLEIIPAPPLKYD